MKLGDGVTTNSRFARSTNIERDWNVQALRGYVPTGRAIDVVRRVGYGLIDAAAGRAFSVTGPHGGGKSSMAVFLASLLASEQSTQHKSAIKLLKEVDPEAAKLFLKGLRAVSPAGDGFAQALVTATREPVSRTLERVMLKLSGTISVTGDGLDPVKAIREFAQKRPTLIVIDEFGKNLEAVAEGNAQGDLFVLQELAELSQGASALPIIVLTMQHLAFDEYVSSTGSAHRREWAKVQGRFQDIPFVESTEQSRRLIASTLTITDRELKNAILEWVQKNIDTADELGLRAELEATLSTYPIHPVVLAVLPQLCSRFGQSERTLFSFMAGSEPLGVPSFLAENYFSGSDELPFVGLDRVYDFFLESSGSSVSASGSASRWMEIENRIRDTWGLDATEETVIKAMGVLNLVSSSGKLRASKPLLEFALNPSSESSRTRQVRKALRSLEERGVITYRDFSDEYRIWQGSDFDLHGAIDLARSEGRGLPLVELLRSSISLPPVVAGRHSQRSGILRVFDRMFVDAATIESALDVEGDLDGRVLLATGDLDVTSVSVASLTRPVVLVVPDSVNGIADLALEVFALSRVVNRAKSTQVDWVAIRELNERLAAAQFELNRRVFATWLPANSKWMRLVKTEAQISPKNLKGRGTASSLLSDVSDEAYSRTPRVANEMLARRELTSQGAKARRLLLEAILRSPSMSTLGLSGYGPERAMYEAVLRSPGFHRKKSNGWIFMRPSAEDWLPVWDHLVSAMEATQSGRHSLERVMGSLEQPPFGLKQGLLPVLAVMYLVLEANNVALYEHGSLVLTLDDAVVERLAKNPSNFAVKFIGTSTGLRRQVIEQVARELNLEGMELGATFLQVVKGVFMMVRAIPMYSQSARADLSVPTLQVREAFKTAVEPDSLFFDRLPVALGMKPFGSGERGNLQRASTFAERLIASLNELSRCYPNLLMQLSDEVSRQTGTPAESVPELRTKLAGQAINLEGRILDPKLRAFVVALVREHLSDNAWVENVAMVVAEGVPPRSWTEEERARFSRNLEELGGQLRRTQALLYENLSWDGEGFETRRITITAPDGGEVSDVVALRISELEDLREALDPVINQVVARYGSKQNALRSLLGLLAVEAGANSHQTGYSMSEKEA